MLLPLREVANVALAANIACIAGSVLKPSPF